jgi:hypothetical protein
MNSRERFRRAINHQQPDRPPIDLGATWVTGISASAYARLRRLLGLSIGTPRIHEPYQLLGDVEEDVRSELGVDVIGLWSASTIFGFRNDVGWKPWTMPDGTEVMVSNDFQTMVEPSGDTLIYPKGDRTAEPSGRLPKGGSFFDAVVRQQPIDDEHLDPSEWAESFGRYTDADLAHFEKESTRIHQQTEYGLVMNFGQGGLGDVAFVPGQNLIQPQGLRDPNLWYEYLLTHTDYIRGIFALQTAAAIENMELLRQAVGDKLDAIIVSGTDFGMQNSLMVSPNLFRDLWKPFYRQMNDWVHANTAWKTFYHTDGAVMPLLDDFVEMGVDILNPVQCSAAGMDAETVKSKYGDKLVFWGGGVDTQKTLPFGTPEEVREEVRERIGIFGAGGGYVFNTIHNILTNTPDENLLALYEAALDRSLVR